MSKLFPLFLFLIACLPAWAQSSNTPSDVLTADFHKTRRDELRRLMPQKSVAVFFANPERNRANDVSYRYHPDPNFYYLTGLLILVEFGRKIAKTIGGEMDLVRADE